MLKASAPEMKVDLPYEIKLKIVGIIKSHELKRRRILNQADFERGLEKENANAILFQTCLLNHSWYSAATRLIWVL